MALLTFAYLPKLVNSLVITDEKGSPSKKKAVNKKLCLNTSLYFVIQSYKILGQQSISENQNGVPDNKTAPKFLRLLTVALFAKDKLPEALLKFTSPEILNQLIKSEGLLDPFTFEKEKEEDQLWKYMLMNYNSEEKFSFFIDKCKEVDKIEELEKSLASILKAEDGDNKEGSRFSNLFKSKAKDPDEGVKRNLFKHVHSTFMGVKILQLHDWLSA
mmetsp:Transcript_28043/g.42400  ORF Transcript_28043/g.42400 Transcript_28043/m.42400 type:complete len:216 (-) Transcript_28043:112-759(-)